MTPIERIIGWFTGSSGKPFDCQYCGEHVESGKRIDNVWRARNFSSFSENCAHELWVNTTA
ncbi:hypothetical protein AHiyo6_05130 [Arthrobacter sp. Hiyo6]|nr:hypothetical protein AHiyo6_05130 [Arthrobacter sp. Hiyo6]